LLTLATNLMKALPDDSSALRQRYSTRREAVAKTFDCG
jgi:hypothetical protein